MATRSAPYTNVVSYPPTCTILSMAEVKGLESAALFSIFHPHGSACAMFRVKRVNLHLRNDINTADIYIYIREKSIVQLTSVGLAQARPNYFGLVAFRSVRVYCKYRGGELYTTIYQYKCLTHSGGDEWCYSPALLCHQSILRNVQSDFTALKIDKQGSQNAGKVAIVFSHNLQWNSSFEPAVLSDPLFIQANICKF